MKLPLRIAEDTVSIIDADGHFISWPNVNEWNLFMIVRAVNVHEALVRVLAAAKEAQFILDGCDILLDHDDNVQTIEDLRSSIAAAEEALKNQEVI